VSRWSYSATAPSAPVPRRESALARGSWHDRCLFLPTGLKEELRQAVAERTRGATTDREKVTALADWIRSSCAYSLTAAAGGGGARGRPLRRAPRPLREHPRRLGVRVGPPRSRLRPRGAVEVPRRDRRRP